jgi:phosphohistidine phosphatase
MKLYLLRHTRAFERDEVAYPDDRLRSLTLAGRRKMAKIAGSFPVLGVQAGLVLSSPFLRARETAEIARKALRLKKDRLILTDNLAPPGEADRLIAEINAQYPDTDLLLVGHEPGLSELASLLLSGDCSLSIELKKGSLCCLSAENLMAGKCATLEWLLSPAQLEII